MQCPVGEDRGDSDGYSSLVPTGGKGQGVDKREHERHTTEMVCLKNQRASMTTFTQRIPSAFYLLCPR